MKGIMKGFPCIGSICHGIRFSKYYITFLYMYDYIIKTGRRIGDAAVQYRAGSFYAAGLMFLANRMIIASKAARRIKTYKNTKKASGVTPEALYFQ